MKETKPVFRKENILYEREEKEGYWTIMSRVHPEERELIINSTARKILELADGTKTINDIEMYFISKYPEVDRGKIKEDILKTLSSFSRIRIIDWEGENPFLYKYEEPVTDGYSLYVGQEDDLKDIKTFINSIIKPIVGFTQKTVLYINPISTLNEYVTFRLRKKLFDFSEEFFLLKNGPNIEGLVSIALPTDLEGSGAVLKLIICPEQFLKNLFEYAKDYLPYLAVKDISKIKIYETNLQQFDNAFKELLLQEGFNREGELKNELGFGNDLVIYSFNYAQEFIERANSQRKKFL
jgi:hypothetical protein